MKTYLMLIGERHPLIHNITNYVAMNFVANSLLAIGASLIMARAEEVGEISAKCQALALNLGIVESSTARSMQIAGKAAHENGVPIVFDVVGVTQFRMKIASDIINSSHPNVIKGNASEIQALYSHQIVMNGVDGSIEPQEIEMKAIKLAQEFSSVIVVTGPTDLVTDGHRVAHIKESHQLMPKVTAMGCTATGFCADRLHRNIVIL